ncbi:hypothetical protein STEG23_014567 [Scotinomys teguina]
MPDTSEDHRSYRGSTEMPEVLQSTEVQTQCSKELKPKSFPETKRLSQYSRRGNFQHTEAAVPTPGKRTKATSQDYAYHGRGSGVVWKMQEHTDKAKEDPECAELPVWKRFPAKLEHSVPKSESS